MFLKFFNRKKKDVQPQDTNSIYEELDIIIARPNPTFLDEVEEIRSEEEKVERLIEVVEGIFESYKFFNLEVYVPCYKGIPLLLSNNNRATFMELKQAKSAVTRYLEKTSTREYSDKSVTITYPWSSTKMMTSKELREMLEDENIITYKKIKL